MYLCVCIGKVWECLWGDCVQMCVHVWVQQVSLFITKWG